MSKQIEIKEFIESVLRKSNFAVLATEGNGQPHTSLVAVTPLKSGNHLVFATYRNTLKFRNLAQNNKVAVLIQTEYFNGQGLKESAVLTIIGHTQEVIDSEYTATFSALLNHHPEMESFLLSSDCSLIQVVANSYQVAYGIDQIKWISAVELNST